VADDSVNPTPPDDEQRDRATLLAQRIAAELQKISIGPEKPAGKSLPVINIFNITVAGDLVHGTLNDIKGNQMNHGTKTHFDVLYLVVVAGMILGIAFIIGGIALTALGATGDTTFSFFGNTFTSQSAGVAAIFCGAVVVALTFRRVIKGVERTTPK